MRTFTAAEAEDARRYAAAIGVEVERGGAIEHITEQLLCYAFGMPRPRTHDLDNLMDVAQQLAVDAGPAAVTIRSLSELTSMSNGALYHAFGSRAGLLGKVWLRDAERMLAAQRDAVQAALAGDTSDAAVAAVVAAADAPAEFLLTSPCAGMFLLTVSRSDLIGDADLPAEVAAELTALDKKLVDLFVRLSEAMWGRADRNTVSVIRDCVVELPTALLLRGRRTPDDAARTRLAAAVRGVLSVDLT